MDGSPCFHQFILWSRKLATCCNFLPVFDQKQRQNYATIALGESLSIEKYESLRGFAVAEDNITHDDVPCDEVVCIPFYS